MELLEYFSVFLLYHSYSQPSKELTTPPVKIEFHLYYFLVVLNYPFFRTAISSYNPADSKESLTLRMRSFRRIAAKPAEVFLPRPDR